jgi:Ca2+-binding EF-hand superfamily protein
MGLVGVDKDIERLKCDLANCEDFNLIDAFGLLDIRGSGSVTPIEMRVALLDLGLRANLEDIEMIFEKFNREGDERLKYSEF